MPGSASLGIGGNVPAAPFSSSRLAAWRSTELAYKEVFARLDADTALAVKLGNYERLIVGARRGVRLYEQYCMKYAGLAIDIRQDNERPSHVKWAAREAIKDAIAWGLAMRAHLLDPKAHPAPSKAVGDSLVGQEDLRTVMTEVLLSNQKPWDDVPLLQPYLHRAPKD